MRPLTTSELLEIWEMGSSYSPLTKSLQLLSKSCEAEASLMATLSIGERDARLLKQREWMFGTRLENLAACPVCAELIEWESDLRELSLQAPTETNENPINTVQADNFQIAFRLPNSNDILSASTHKDPSKVLASCIIAVTKEERECNTNDLSNAAMDVLGQYMEELDPQANLLILLDCTGCNHNWSVYFDIISYFWHEIDNWARSTLHEIFLLAQGLSWTEKDILSLSPQRRRIYLEMLRS